MDIHVIFHQLITLFLVIALGYALRKGRVIDDAFADGLSRFVLDVTMPFLILSSVLGSSAAVENPVGSMAAACVILTVLLPVLALLFVHLFPAVFLLELVPGKGGIPVLNGEIRTEWAMGLF